MASHFHTRGSQGAPWRPLTLALFTNHTTYMEPHNFLWSFQNWNAKKKGAIWAMLTPALLGAYNNFQQGVQRCATRPKNIILRWKVLKSFTPSNKCTNPLSQLVTCPHRVLVVIEFQSTCCHNWAINNLLPYLGNILIRRTMRPIRGLDDYVTYFCNCFSLEMPELGIYNLQTTCVNRYLEQCPYFQRLWSNYF